jgi:galactokinase
MPETRQTDAPLRLLMAFHQAFDGAQPDHVIQAPGREMWVAASVVDREFAVYAPDLEGRAVFSWQSAKQRRTILNRPLPHWARYPAGVIILLCQSGLDIPGIRAVVVGEEVGPRYEYSIGIAFAALWHHLHDAHVSSEDLIDIVERARREYVSS